MAKYAKETEVSPEQSMIEIRQVIKRYGATGFAVLEEADQVGIVFEMRGWRVRFVVALPRLRDFALKSTGAKMAAVQQHQAHEKAIRQVWRVLLLTIKAKLEAVESGVETFERAFLAYVMLPNGMTMGDWMIPQVRSALETQSMPPMLPSGS